MGVAHIVLGCLLLYDKTTINFRKANAYVFLHNGKSIRLAPTQSLDHNKTKGINPKLPHSKK